MESKIAIGRGVLSEQAQIEGWQLSEPDDHILQLWCGNVLIATFSQGGATIEAIQHVIGRQSRN